MSALDGLHRTDSVFYMGRKRGWGRCMEDRLLDSLVAGIFVWDTVYIPRFWVMWSVFHYSVTPSLVLFVVTYHVKLDVEALQHHVQRK
jgi:hypothetical protein